MNLSKNVREKLPHDLADHLTGVHYDNGLSRDPYLETVVLKMGSEGFNLRQDIHACGSPGAGNSTYWGNAGDLWRHTPSYVDSTDVSPPGRLPRPPPGFTFFAKTQAP